VKHVRVLESNNATPSGQRDTLIARATGRFYTPEVVGNHLAQGMCIAARNLRSTGATVAVVDPFCGDGRLLAWLIGVLAATRHDIAARYVVELWDRDERALRSAKRTVTNTVRTLGINAVVRPVLCDSFEHAPARFGQFDLVITNPPWDVLKPDARELRTLNSREASEYVGQLRRQADRLAELYPLSMPAKRYSGWGVNLARCGTELALRLARNRGVVGFVSPATLLADFRFQCARPSLLPCRGQVIQRGRPANRNGCSDLGKAEALHPPPYRLRT
jgi:Alw26I/Eco31I/Esp3I family type II restriction m6 adenine DNA methyltransferase